MENSPGMKHGWLMLTGVCAVVSGIVLFCVVGRRVHPAFCGPKTGSTRPNPFWPKNVSNGPALSGTLLPWPPPVLSPEVFNTLKKQDALAMSILNEADQIKVPLSPGQVNEIEASQHQLSRQIFFVIGEMEQVQSIKDANSFRDLSRAIKDQTQIVIYTHKTVITKKPCISTPGNRFSRAFWWPAGSGLDQMTFPQIPVRIFEFEEPPSKGRFPVMSPKGDPAMADQATDLPLLYWPQGGISPDQERQCGPDRGAAWRYPPEAVPHPFVPPSKTGSARKPSPI